MMFLNAQKPGLIKDPYIYKPDSLLLDLEDAVAMNQKDAARFSLYHALQEIDYHGCERIVRINKAKLQRTIMLQIARKLNEIKIIDKHIDCRRFELQAQVMVNHPADTGRTNNGKIFVLKPFSPRFLFIREPNSPEFSQTSLKNSSLGYVFIIHFISPEHKLISVFSFLITFNKASV